MKPHKYNFCPKCGNKMDHDSEDRIYHRYKCRSGDLIIEFFDYEYPVGIEEEWWVPTGRKAMNGVAFSPVLREQDGFIWKKVA